MDKEFNGLVIGGVWDGEFKTCLIPQFKSPIIRDIPPLNWDTDPLAMSAVIAPDHTLFVHIEHHAVDDRGPKFYGYWVPASEREHAHRYIADALYEAYSRLAALSK